VEKHPGFAWLEAVPDVVLIVDGGGRIVHANERCAALLGWSPAEIEGLPVERLVPARLATAHAAHRASYAAAPVVRPMGEDRDLCALNRAGEEIAVDVALSPIAVAGADYVVVSIRDARAKRARLEEIGLQAIALDAAASGIVITDPEGVILWTNRAVSRLTGYAPEELLGRRPSLFKSGQHGESFYEELWGTITDGRTWQGAIVNRRKDGTLYHEEQTIAPVRDAWGQIRHFIAVKQDVTERIRSDREVREAHAELARRVAEVEQLHAQLREQAIRDELSGLFNRRYFDETLAREVARATRDRIPLTVVMLDLDHFKRINDREGHAAGDRLLADLGRILLAEVRSGDAACRWGGDEFSVVLLGADLEAADHRAESWRRSFSRVAGRAAGGERCTLSAGVAQLQPEESCRSLLARADAALYQAKEQGRDRVVASRPAPEGAEPLGRPT
jgi:diguanylate cyclase (GGDEF)-like protein/PAS domain S-box-containing protein